jgi:hypothetical protein
MTHCPGNPNFTSTREKIVISAFVFTLVALYLAGALAITFFGT